MEADTFGSLRRTGSKPRGLARRPRRDDQLHNANTDLVTSAPPVPPPPVLTDADADTDGPAAPTGHGPRER
ncbi:hypothetical protein ABT236_19585 [Streptomyces sp. NPDC001523]|uniref:hypothetical protein n=1 Tax=Streptomyces sp. NPDC001523 TaxID=3154383 RepID=UPI003330DE66